MAYLATTATHKLLRLRKRIKLIPGGTSAGKTISILQILIDKAQSDASPTLTSIVSESFPHLKRGAMRDFLNIMQAHDYFVDKRWNKTDYIYTFETGSTIEFFSADQPGKVRGPRRDRLYVNEVNNVAQEAWEQLTIRTRQEIWADWNPVNDFWMYEEYGLDDEATPATSTDDRVDVLILTYKDNEGLEDSIIEDIERRAALNKSWKRVYAEGKRGELEGKIYRDWLIIEDVPHEARLERRGLDFGYSADPAGLVDIYYLNGAYVLDEQLYQLGMSNRAIAEQIKNLPAPQTLTVADSAEPKSIDELKLYGINVMPANKGPGSVHQGISYLQDQRVYITKRSANLIKEYRMYMWKFDKDGKQLDVPEDGNDHLMDAIRYAMESLRPSKPLKPRERPKRTRFHV
jgi:phage terminase large subunit